MGLKFWAVFVCGVGRCGSLSGGSHDRQSLVLWMICRWLLVFAEEWLFDLAVTSTGRLVMRAMVKCDMKMKNASVRPL